MPDANPLLQPPPPPPGLINTAPGLINQVPGQSPPGAPPGAPVTSYTPGQAKPTDVSSKSYTPEAFAVTPEQTVVSQIRDIIAEDSPLMRQAEAKAKSEMNARGLLNSTMAVTAGQDSVYKAAFPIASADALTYERAATNATTGRNRALEFGAGAENAALMRAAEIRAATEQFNVGQQNAAMSDAAKASNTLALQTQQLKEQRSNLELQLREARSVAEMQDATQRAMAQLQSTTNLSIADKQAATAALVANINANTSLGVADKQAASSQIIAGIQRDTSLTIAQQQAETARLTAQLQAQTAIQVQDLQNSGNLANILADGNVRMQIATLQENNKAILQTSSGAANVWNQTLQNISTIMTDPKLDGQQKTVALNNAMAGLNDALASLTGISNTPGVNSLLQFGGTQALGADAPMINSIWMETLGRPADQAALDAFAGQTAAQVRATLMASDEYRARQSAGSPANAAMISSVWQEVLGRPADQAAISAHAGQTPEQVRAILMASPEYRAAHPNG